MDQERRTSPRLRSLLTGQVVLNGVSSTLSCTVRNISRDGAKLVFGDLSALPQTFELIIDKRDTRVMVDMAWRTPFEVGVRFQ